MFFMQIIISMAGFGSRFTNAGFKTPKHFLPIGSKPIIEYVIDNFSINDEFIFICREDEEYKSHEKIKKLADKKGLNYKIFLEPPHKTGPIPAVHRIIEHIDLKTPVIVNYCDFHWLWDYEKFKEFALVNNFKGIVPAYKGFHPHSLYSNYYGYLKTEGNVVIDYKEKESFTDNHMEEYASSGTYYFSTGQILKDAVNYALDNDLKVNGEYYMSMAYKYLLDNNLKTGVYEIKKFMQLGTPEDYNEFLGWYNYFHNETFSAPKIKANMILPMVGEGRRFKEANYTEPKPLIKANNRELYLLALDNLPKTDTVNIVINKNAINPEKISNSYDLNAELNLVTLDYLTEGQAMTCLEAVKNMNEEESIIISCCDTQLIYDTEKFLKLYNDDKVDLIVFTKKDYRPALIRPQMYGWLESDENNKITGVSVKQAKENHDEVIVSTFFFKKIKDYKKAVARMVEQNRRINNEFYVDECIRDMIELGFNCYTLPIEHYISLGTPIELDIFNYWLETFNDPNFDKNKITKPALV